LHYAHCFYVCACACAGKDGITTFIKRGSKFGDRQNERLRTGKTLFNNKNSLEELDKNNTQVPGVEQISHDQDTRF